jgi:hypothetical protein
MRDAEELTQKWDEETYEELEAAEEAGEAAGMATGLSDLNVSNE